ncbi:MAG TPA: cytochrome c [Steroidobacteraceae bacterium]|jgi:mono/diheme cytochrome c family protein
MSGQDLYGRFCASCHGIEGRGDGPVAKSFRVEVPDLTLTASRGHSGDPRDRIVRIIDGRYIIGAHGTRLMPVWGEDLARLEIGNPDAERSAQLIIGRLADYVSSLQRKTSD